MKLRDGWAVYHECGEQQMQTASRLLSMYERAGEMDNKWRKECLDLVFQSLKLAQGFWGGGK